MVGSTVTSTSDHQKKTKKNHTHTQKIRMKSKDVVRSGSDGSRGREIRGVYSIKTGLCIAFKDHMVPSFSRSQLYCLEQRVRFSQKRRGYIHDSSPNFDRDAKLIPCNCNEGSMSGG